ncbi:MAG: hypothetical protein L0Y71_19490 [Gemmataceae bacterium]|nr:hypothetical protein [Gemmataceae bacterium]
MCARCRANDQLGVVDAGAHAAWVGRIQRAGALLNMAGAIHIVCCLLTPGVFAVLDHQQLPARDWLRALAGLQMLAGIILGPIILRGESQRAGLGDVLLLVFFAA